MANLDWADVLWISGVATVGFTLFSFWFSGLMAKKGWSWQVRAKPKKKRS